MWIENEQVKNKCEKSDIIWWTSGDEYKISKIFEEKEETSWKKEETFWKKEETFWDKASDLLNKIITPIFDDITSWYKTSPNDDK